MLGRNKSKPITIWRTILLEISAFVKYIVCGISENYVHMITAYRPERDKWEDDMNIVNYKEKVA